MIPVHSPEEIDIEEKVESLCECRESRRDGDDELVMVRTGVRVAKGCEYGMALTHKMPHITMSFSAYGLK